VFVVIGELGYLFDNVKLVIAGVCSAHASTPKTIMLEMTSNPAPNPGSFFTAKNASSAVAVAHEALPQNYEGMRLILLPNQKSSVAQARTI
jgi:hypothetical protein